MVTGSIERIPTFVNGLDVMLRGGLPENSMVMVAGVTGSMKTSLVYYVLSRNAGRGRSAVFMSLEQPRENLLTHLKEMGLEKPASLRIWDISGLRDREGYETHEDWLELIPLFFERKKEAGEEIPDMLAVDSLNALYSLSSSPISRNDALRFINRMRRLGSTILFVSEMPLTRDRYSHDGVEEFMLDGIIHVDLREVGSTFQRTIQVVKMRATDHSLERMPLVFQDREFYVLGVGGSNSSLRREKDEWGRGKIGGG